MSEQVCKSYAARGVWRAEDGRLVRVRMIILGTISQFVASKLAFMKMAKACTPPPRTKLFPDSLRIAWQQVCCLLFGRPSIFAITQCNAHKIECDRRMLGILQLLLLVVSIILAWLKHACTQHRNAAEMSPLIYRITLIRRAHHRDLWA